MRMTTLLMTVLLLAGCSTSSLVLEPNGRISATIEVGYSTKVNDEIDKVKEAMQTACGGAERLELATMQGEEYHSFIDPDNLTAWLALIEQAKKLTGKTTVTLAGRCKRDTVSNQKGDGRRCPRGDG